MTTMFDKFRVYKYQQQDGSFYYVAKERVFFIFYIRILYSPKQFSSWQSAVDYIQTVLNIIRSNKLDSTVNIFTKRGKYIDHTDLGHKDVN